MQHELMLQLGGGYAGMDADEIRPPRKRMTLRFSTREDVEKLTAYYAENTHKNVYARENEILRERIESGAAIILEDDKGKIHGASVAYPLMREKDGEMRHEWSEIGSTRITLNGFGLYPYMIAAQTVQGFVMEPPEDRFVAEVDVYNAPVIGMLHGKLQWPEYDAPKDLTDLSEASVDSTVALMPVNWYHCGPEAIGHQARVVKELVENPVLKNKKTGEEIEIDLSRFPLANAFRPVLDRLAEMDKDAAPAQTPENRPRKKHEPGLSALRKSMRL